MSNLAVRILTAVIAGTAVVAAIWFSPWGLFAFCAILSVLGILEFYKITGIRWAPAYIVAIVFAIVVWVWVAFHSLVVMPYSPAFSSFLFSSMFAPDLLGSMVLLILWAVLMFGLIMGSLFRKQNPDPVKEMAVTGMGYFYAFFPFVLFFMLHTGRLIAPETLDPDQQALLGYLNREHFASPPLQQGSLWDTSEYITTPQVQTPPAPTLMPAPHYRYMALGILFLFWTLDSFAYFGGRLFGKHKLFERISPKKTWEGSLIGAGFCIGLGVLFQFVWPVGWNWIVLAAIISVTGQLGDLVESMFKRSLQLKDSGGLLPGHGGILDRFDGFIISVPFIALFLLLTQWFC